MIRSELIDIAYRYYPRNIDCINQKEYYILTSEYKNLLEKIENNKKQYSKNKIIINKLEHIGTKWGKFKDATYFEWQDRCFTFEFTKEYENTFLQLKLYQSILLPIYFIKYFKITPSNNNPKYIKISKEEFLDLNFLSSIKFILEDNNFTEFDYKLAYSIIKDINFDDIQMGKFTFFNTFFNSENI